MLNYPKNVAAQIEADSLLMHKLFGLEQNKTDAVEYLSETIENLAEDIMYFTFELGAEATVVTKYKANTNNILISVMDPNNLNDTVHDLDLLLGLDSDNELELTEINEIVLGPGDVQGTNKDVTKLLNVDNIKNETALLRLFLYTAKILVGGKN